jgi:hypothetical protein
MILYVMAWKHSESRAVLGACFGIPFERLEIELGLSRLDKNLETGLNFRVQPEWLTVSLFGTFGTEFKELVSEYMLRYNEIKYKIEPPEHQMLAVEVVDLNALTRRINGFRSFLRVLMKVGRSVRVQRDKLMHDLQTEVFSISNRAVLDLDEERQVRQLFLREMISKIDELEKLASRDYYDLQELNEEARELQEKVLQMVHMVSKFSQPMLTIID